LRLGIRYAQQMLSVEIFCIRVVLHCCCRGGTICFLLSLMAFDFYKIGNERLKRHGLDDARQELYLFLYRETYRDAVFLDLSACGSLAAAALSRGDSGALFYGAKRAWVEVCHGLLSWEVQSAVLP